MAVVNTLTTVITNADASPIVLNKAQLSKGLIHTAVGTLEAVSGDSIGSTYRFARVRTSDRIASIKLYCDAITTCTADVGCYRTGADGGAVVDADCWGSAVSLASAITTGTEVQFEAAVVFEIAHIERQVWQVLGYATDPGYVVDIVLTLTAAAGSAGTISLRVDFVPA